MRNKETTMSDEEMFRLQCTKEIEALGTNTHIQGVSTEWLALAQQNNYSYHFRWLGRPIIQYPQDIVAMQELIWQVNPDLIIETGVARGGSVIFSASILALLDLCSGRAPSTTGVPSASDRRVIGIDIDIRPHNREAIESHPLSSMITLIQGSSIEPDIVQAVTSLAKKARSVLVCLDSNHSHQHVLKELEAYAPLTTPGSYCVVFDTVVEDLPPEAIGDRPWAKGNSPKTAVHTFLRTHPEFTVDKTIDAKLLISVAPDGYLKRIV